MSSRKSSTPQLVMIGKRIITGFTNFLMYHKRTCCILQKICTMHQHKSSQQWLLLGKLEVIIYSLLLQRSISVIYSNVSYGCSHAHTVVVCTNLCLILQVTVYIKKYPLWPLSAETQYFFMRSISLLLPRDR